MSKFQIEEEMIKGEIDNTIANKEQGMSKFHDQSRVLEEKLTTQ